MLKCFSGTDADEVWAKAASALLGGDRQEGRGGSTTELLHVGLSISNPIARWVTTRRPAINPAFPIVEAIWILAGRRDSATLNFWNPALPRFAGSGQEYHGAYGWRLRTQFGFDQIERAIDALGSLSATRQIVLQIWDPRSDFPHGNGSPSDPDIPCNTSSHLKIRNNRLEWLQVMRSNDVFLGTPHNLVQFTVLQEIVAGRLGVELGTYSVVADSFHVYAKDLEAVESSLRSGTRIAKEPPRFGVADGAWSTTLPRLTQIIDAVRSAESASDLNSAIASASTLPADWPSAIAIVVADAARRFRWETAVDHAISACQNAFLLELWNRWRSRVAAPESATP